MLAIAVSLSAFFGALDVQWIGPEACGPIEFGTAVSSASGQVRIEVANPRPGTWTLDLKYLSPFQASRHLELGSCADVRKAARALVVLGLSGALPPAEEVPPAEPGPPPEKPSPPVQPPRPPATEHLRFGVGAGAHATAFLLPGVSGRAFVRGLLRFGAFQTELAVRLGWPVTYPGGPVDGAGVRLWPTVGGQWLGCFNLTFGALRPGACGSAVVEWWQLEGMGVTTPARGSAAFVALGAQLRVAIALVGGFELVPFAAVHAHPTRPVARFDGVDALTTGLVDLELGASLDFVSR